VAVSQRVVLKHKAERALPGGRFAKLFSVLLIFGVWEAFVRGYDVPPYILPAFSAVIEEIVRQVATGELFLHLLYTISRSVIGIVVGGLVGLILGLFMGWYRWFEQFSAYVVSATYPLPKIALIPLLIVWLGLGEMPRLVMAFVGVLYPVLINTIVGVKSVDPVLVKAARDMGASDRQLFWEVMLPGSLPMVFAGLKLGSGVAFILVVASEMLYGQYGVGFQVQDAASILQMPRVFAGLTVLSVLGILLFAAVDRLQQWAIPWHVEKG